MERYILDSRRKLPLEAKVNMSLLRIREWYEAHNGMVYVSYSGGKDSTVLLHLVRTAYPEVPAVFSDTGLEWPSVREFALNTPNLVVVKPKYTFKEIIDKYGYPVISKETACYLYELARTKSEKLRDLRLNGRGPKRQGGIPKRWLFMKDAPFKVSAECCKYLKKNPLRNYNKTSGRVPYIGTLASDSKLREQLYLKVGCNSFGTKYPASSPLGFWTENDIWEYIKTRSIPYASVYDQGITNTGCVFCLFGFQFHKDKFEIMKKLEPKMYSYCMDKLGLREILKFTYDYEAPK